MSKIKLVCHYDGKPVYFDGRNKDSIAIAHGPLEEQKNLPGLVYRNNETGAMTNQDGTPYQYQKVEYGIKAYLVGTDDINEATKQIEQALNIYE